MDVLPLLHAAELFDDELRGLALTVEAVEVVFVGTVVELEAAHAQFFHEAVLEDLETGGGVDFGYHMCRIYICAVSENDKHSQAGNFCRFFSSSCDSGRYSKYRSGTPARSARITLGTCQRGS